MPKWISAIFVFFLSTTLLKARAITAEEIISKHKAATGIGKHHHYITVDAGLLTGYAEKGFSARLEGIETINGKPCYKISVEIKPGRTVNFLIDTKSWYIIRRHEIQLSQPGKELHIMISKLLSAPDQ